MRFLDITSRLLAGQTARQILAILLVIEAVFIAESFTSLLETIMRYGGNALDVARILVLKMPEIVEFGLPLAILFGVYFAVSNAREDRELIVCAAAGAPWKRIPVFAAIVGIIGFMASLTISGIIAPLSAYSERLSLAEIRSQQIINELKNPGTHRKIHSVAGRTFISSTENSHGVKGRYLFTHHPSNGRDWHVSQAGNWDIKGPLDNGNYAIFMRAFTDYKGYQPVKQGVENTGIPKVKTRETAPRFTSMNVEKVILGFKLADLSKATDRNQRINELSLAELQQRFADDEDGKIRRRVGEILARALLNPAAALLAIATVAFSTGVFGRLLALPFATIIILLFDMAGRVLMSEAALAGSRALAFALAVSLVVFTLPSLIYILRRGEKFIIPASGRA